MSWCISVNMYKHVSNIQFSSQQTNPQLLSEPPESTIRHQICSTIHQITSHILLPVSGPPVPPPLTHLIRGEEAPAEGGGAPQTGSVTEPRVPFEQNKTTELNGRHPADPRHRRWIWLSWQRARSAASVLQSYPRRSNESENNAAAESLTRSLTPFSCPPRGIRFF